MAVVIRPAKASDKESIMSFVKDIWRGHDYIPKVWDTWIRDENGKMFVAEVEGKPVAMNRVRYMDDGSAWLEGVRVHPDHRRRGLATRLGRNAMKFAFGKGFTKIRLTTGSTNRAAHGQIAKMGLAEVARMSLYSSGKRRFRPVRGVRRAKPSDVPFLLKTIMGSREYAAGGGVYWDRFAATSTTLDTLRKLVRKGSVYLVGGGIAISELGGEGSEIWRQICFATGPTQDIVTLVKYLFGREERVKTTWNIVYAPPRSPLVRTLSKAGLTRWGSFVLFEGKSPKS
jgi:GNAT superfamily N-acetyltransferase